MGGARRASCSAPWRKGVVLQHRAQAHKRSLSQQALADLEAIAGGDPRERRRQVLDRIARRGPLATALSGDLAPEELIRADRER